MGTVSSSYTSLYAQWSGYTGIGPGMMGWGYGMGWLGPAVMILFLVTMILLIVFLARGLSSSSRHTIHGAMQEDSALEILRKRYARGEINKEEFEEKKKSLET